MEGKFRNIFLPGRYLINFNKKAMRKLVLFLVAGLFIASSLTAQNKDNLTRKELKAEKKATMEKEVEEKLKSKNFTFKARQANPMSGSSINLTSEYDLKMKNDSAFAYLPFFGVAYRAEYGSTEGGIKFEEIASEYKMNLKKDIYTIEFTVKSSKDQYDCVFTISKSGYGTLQISSNNRQQISFYGILEGLGI